MDPITASSKAQAPPRHHDEEPHPKNTRTIILRGLALCLIAAFILSNIQTPVSYYHGRLKRRSFAQESVDQRARRILSENPLIDGHIDFAVVLREVYGNQIDNAQWSQRFQNGTLSGHVDLARLRKGLSGGAFWSVFAPCPAKGQDFSDENLAASVQYTMDQIDATDRAYGAYPNDFALNIDHSGALNAFKHGKLISPLGVEGLHQIGNSVSNLRLFHRLGARYVTLTHNCHNIYADAACLENPFRKAEPHWHGVSPLGRQLIHEMNRIGMIVDLSHVSEFTSCWLGSEETMTDILGGRSDWPGSRAPIIFSHSSAWAICPHPRNVKDHVLQRVKQHNSVVMVNISPDFIACVDKGNQNGIPEPDPEHADLDQVVRHIMYIGNLIGYDHVGLGTDFDGIPAGPRGFEDVSKYPDLVIALLNAGVDDSDVAKIVGRNVLRVWKDVDSVSAQMKAEDAPVMEDNRKPT
ncbi:hypothetical protein CDD82_7361 [Ophiocordyceps australis]|uniref:Dipeptidase n=1 Tax=Ophiocordyceps australis TaxID=1399860 RepID=A0A2C5YMQ4_9HYPO|nr:hypothetical protein CDD82_7361 [Ophiocordyceps australis]